MPTVEPEGAAYFLPLDPFRVVAGGSVQFQWVLVTDGIVRGLRGLEGTGLQLESMRIGLEEQLREPRQMIEPLMFEGVQLRARAHTAVSFHVRNPSKSIDLTVSPVLIVEQLKPSDRRAQIVDLVAGAMWRVASRRQGIAGAWPIEASESWRELATAALERLDDLGLVDLQEDDVLPSRHIRLGGRRG